VNVKRSRAYGRVMWTLDRAEPPRFTGESRQLLREAADTLIFATEYDRSVGNALALARAVLLTAHPAGYDPVIDQLADDLEDAGPMLR
jgi:hypothetical protein